MLKVGELFGKNEEIRTFSPHDKLITNDLLGIEVELEGVPNPPKLKYWQDKEDGSLRDGGIEYVFRSPYCGHDAYNALLELEESMSAISPKMSPRTSVHVHIDIRDLSPEAVFRFIEYFIIFERVLINYCGESRKSNIFCLPFYEAEGNLDYLYPIKNGISEEIKIDRLYHLTRSGRYSALNLRSMETFGSLEIRTFRGEYRTEELLKWVNILLSIKDASRNIAQVDDSIVYLFSSLGPMGFLGSVFKNNTELLIYPSIEEDLIEGMRIAQDVCFKEELHSSRQAKVRRRLKDRKFSESYISFIKNNYPAKYSKYEGILNPSSSSTSVEKSALVLEKEFGIARPETMPVGLFVEVLSGLDNPQTIPMEGDEPIADWGDELIEEAWAEAATGIAAGTAATRIRTPRRLR